MRFSIVIPTHGRRDLVTHNVDALRRQTERDFEVIVVDDGSADGTAAALRALEVPFPLKVLEQENHGAGAARNAGAALAEGDYILFLDDDMEAEPRMLSEHLRSHRVGPAVVLGDLPLHPRSPAHVVSRAVGQWTRDRAQRLSRAGAEVPADDILTGQISLSRRDYELIGGFDVGFTRRGLVPGADLDFGARARKAGLRVLFNARAISYQYYDVEPGEYLERAYHDGRSSFELLLKHPDRPQDFGRVRGFHRRRDRWLLGPLAHAPAAASWPLRAGVVALVRTGHRGRRLHELFFLVRTMERQRGLNDARREHALTARRTTA